MGTISARAVIVKTQRILHDTTGVRWPLDEMLGWLCSGQRAIVALRPDASSATVPIPLQAGTLQRIPQDALRLLSVVCNLGPDDRPGRTIRFVEREILDAQHPDWHNGDPAPSPVALHWTYDEREPKTFYVFPAQPSGGGVGKVLAVVSKTPASCTLKGVKGEDDQVGTQDSPISIDDIFEDALIDYMQYRAKLKEAEYAGHAGKADQAYSKFLNSLGLKTETDKRFAVRRSAPPHVNPNVPGNSGAFGD